MTATGTYQSFGDRQPAEQYIPFVRKIARRIARQLPNSVDVDDLVGAGTVGLMEALSRYNAAQGGAFETYAEYRVKGAILDELRRHDPLNRAARSARNKIEAKRKELTATLGRPPDDDEVSAALDVRHRRDISIAGALRVVPLDIKALALTANGPSQEEMLAKNELVALVREAIVKLPEKQQVALSLVYLEGMSQVQVAEILGVTESRVSQILSAARKPLKKILEREVN